MRIDPLTATADIVGRRALVAWRIALDDGEGVAAVPPVALRRKQRDFEFPDPGGGPDPFLIFDSAAFPPAGGTVTEVDLGETLSQGMRTVTTVQSVSREVDGVPVEVLRRTRAVTFDARRMPVAVGEEILDVGGGPGLEPGTTYYYELSGPDLGFEDPEARRAVATPTEVHRSGRTLYELLPAILRRHDVAAGPVRATGAIPEAAPQNGQLRRFIDLFGAAADHLRSRADGLRGLHDVDSVDHRMLPHMAALLGWDLSHGTPIPVQRHEIKFAAHLYRITGTVPGATIWVKRLTGWDVRIKEFWRNVAFSNDLGNPHDPADRGSRTVDTADAALIAAIGTFEDAVDYTYDTGTGPDDRHATNVVGVFARPEPGDSAEDVVAKRARVLGGANRFLPFNLRPVVILETDAVNRTAQLGLGLTRGEDDT